MTFDPRTESNIATLHPVAQAAARQFMAAVTAAMTMEEVVVKIIAGTRTYAEQDALYAQGRTKRGPRVTNARGGYSNHNFGIAWDIGLFKGPQYLDDSPLYRTCGSIGRSLGLEWGGDWQSIDDEPHFQLKTGLTLVQMRGRIARGQSVV
jgi:peptidoglycan LD-endopeptidase CwlK